MTNIKLRIFKKSIYIKSNLFIKLKKEELELAREKTIQIIKEKEITNISSLDWRVLNYIREKNNDISITYLAYIINYDFHGKNKDLKKYKELYIKDCDTWSFNALWFDGYHPANYSNSYIKSFEAINKKNNNLKLINQKKLKLITLEDILIKNKNIKKITKTKSHLISPHEIIKIFEKEGNKKANEQYNKIKNFFNTLEIIETKKHVQKLKKIRDGLLIDTRCLNLNRKRNKIEQNILSEVFLLFEDYSSYLKSRCIELNTKICSIEESAFKFIEDTILKEELIFFNELKYKNLIKNKSIAIVCPGPLEKKQMKTLKDFDIVVCFNIYESIPINNNQKTIINIAPTLSIYNDSLDDYSKIDQITTNLTKPIFNREKVRVLFYPNKFLFNACPAALQRFLYDLINFKPHKIKVFGSTLHVTVNGKKYQDNYLENRNKKFKFLDNNNNKQLFNVHDPLANFLFTKYLFRKKIIEVDNQLKEILDLKPHQYLEKLFNTRIEL